MISAKDIKSLPYELLQNVDLEVHECVSSTNDLAKEYAKNNPERKAAIIALAQTAGRGRRGRSFFSPDGTGLYMSIVLRPSYTPEISSLLTSAAAVATARAIEKVSEKSVSIKWINDIFLDGKKICGILCESTLSADTSKVDYVVVGIGINLADPKNGFPNELRDIAASVFGKKKPNDDVYALLCGDIINSLLEYSSSLEKPEFIKEYRKRLFMLGEEISVITPSGTYSAIAKDIDENAHLIVKLPDGSQKTLEAGEISVRPKKG